ncbi:MAG: CvpA family protein [Micropepsaceae bacterium]
MFTIFDLVIIAVLILSALLAAWRGFTREVLSIGAWIGAAVVMFLAGPTAVPFAKAYIDHEMVAMIAAYAAIFVLALIPLSYISFRIAEGVQGSAIGPVDRLLGLVFGAGRGLVVLGIGYLVFVSLVSEARMPDWFKEARLRPLVESSGKVIASLLPSRDKAPKPEDKDTIIGGKPKPAAAPETAPAEPEDTAEPAPEPTPAPAKPKPPKPAPPAAPTEAEADATEGAQGYGERERDALDQLIGTATASPSDEGDTGNGDSGGR